MCGIAGIVSLSADQRVDEAALRLMSDQIVHRGPDDSGHYVDPRGRCGLAFRRLSIIDLAGGHQPMGNEDGGVQVVFNGEIYNFRDLRPQLEAAGHRFQTHSDTEVIVHGYEEWGEDVFRKIAGMFAVAIWDERKGMLLLGRDRLGKKPLHYATIGNHFYFASELKAIVALPGVPRRVDWRAVHEYLTLQYVPAPQCIYRGFGKIEPGSQLTVTAGKAPTAPQRRFWRVPVRARFDGEYEDAKTRLGELLTSAVDKRLVADVPLGAFLSGGIDSSIVVGLMRRLGASPLRTFTVGFENERYNEAPHARRAAEHFETEHHEYVCTPKAREILDTLAFHYDEPFADPSAIPTWYVSYYTRKSVTVALAGDGGDELFAGYHRYRALRFSQRLGIVPRPVRQAVAAGAGFIRHGSPGRLSSKAHRFLKALSMPPAMRYLDYMSIFTPGMLREGYRPEFSGRVDLDEPFRWFESLFDEREDDPVARAMHTDINSYLPYDLLTKVDIASMAVSLECRAPFLDHELVEFAASLPVEWLLGPLGSKHILKDWARTLLPPEILARGKQGFGVPLAEWFRKELRDLIDDRILAADSLSNAIFRPEWLRELVEAHMSGRANHNQRLWALLMLELWKERWSPVIDL